MKKILKYVGLGISAAILFFSCAKSEEYTPGGTIDMTVVAGDPSVKTVIDEYEAGGKRMFALWNNTKEEKTFDILGRTVTLPAGEVACEVFPAEEGECAAKA